MNQMMTSEHIVEVFDAYQKLVYSVVVNLVERVGGERRVYLDSMYHEKDIDALAKRLFDLSLKRTIVNLTMKELTNPLGMCIFWIEFESMEDGVCGQTNITSDVIDRIVTAFA